MKPVSVFLFFIFSATFIFAQSTKELDSSVVFSPLKNIPKKEKLLKITNFLNLGNFHRGEQSRIILQKNFTGLVYLFYFSKPRNCFAKQNSILLHTLFFRICEL